MRGLFAVNVPYAFPALEVDWGGDDRYALLGDGGDGPPVLFRPREWRGNGCGAPFRWDCLSARQFAREISGYARGSVVHTYVTSDGGASLDDIYELVGELDDHVEVVHHEALIDLALQRSASQK